LKIRTRLRALILLTLLPVGLLGIAGAWYLVVKEREALERGLQVRVQGLIMAVDAEIKASIAALEILAGVPSLQTDDLTTFRVEAERAVASRRYAWENIVLTDAQTKTTLVNLLVPPGRPLVNARDPQSLVDTVTSRRVTVGNVVIGNALKRPIVSIRYPILRDGEPIYVLTAIVDVRRIAEIVEQQRIPESFTVAVVDANFRFVVRRPGPPRGLEHASPALKKAISGGMRSWQPGHLLGGERVYRFVEKSSISAWAAAIAVPERVVFEGLRGVWFFVAGLIGAMVLGLWVAWVLASRISRPIAALAAAAPAVGRGDADGVPSGGDFEEVRLLAQALRDAANTTRQRGLDQEAADRAKDEFLAMLGHELRNPLASVANVAHVLSRSPHEPALVSNVSAILRRQVEQMSRLVDDLLDAGRVTAGKIRLERIPVDLGELTHDLVETWRAENRFSRHQLHVRLDSVWVHADQARLQQVIGNLIDNALRYTPAGGRIDVAVSRSDSNAVLTIQDTGIGMSPELKARAFDLFAQGDRTLAREAGGLGIGLTMAKTLLGFHGGTIAVESEGTDQGCRFIATLPAIEAPRAAAAAPTAAAGKRSTRILLVEDDEDARESLATLLTTYGHTVEAVDAGLAGIHAYAQGKFDVALIDIGLPDIDGYEVARRIREQHPARSLRLIALTGYGSPEDKKRALAAGFDEHVVKPISMEVLEALLQSA